MIINNDDNDDSNDNNNDNGNNTRFILWQPKGVGFVQGMHW